METLVNLFEFNYFKLYINFFFEMFSVKCV